MPTGDETKLPLTSRDVNAERLAQFRELFPEAFTEGKLDLKKLPSLLGDAATDAPERYGLSWSGKSDAIKAIQTLTSATLLPCPEESFPPLPFAVAASRQSAVIEVKNNAALCRDAATSCNTSENLIIEGDNLETLKLLQGGYHGRVKMIYIDPPYNTGNEFIYPDNYKEGLADYLKFSGQVNEEGIKQSTNRETDGRYHSKWLTMMYPRLFLAKNLLREDGVIFVSIDDHEVHNLRAVMNEIFGEENFVANIVWQKKYAVSSDDPGIAPMHDHILVYQRSADFDRNLLPRTEKQTQRYTNLDNDPRGVWSSDNYVSNKSRQERPTLWYPIRHPKTGENVWPDESAVWRYSREKHSQMERENRLYWGPNLSYKKPRLKRFLSEVPDGIVPSTWWPFQEVGHNDEGQKETSELIGPKIFTTPKPIRLLERIIGLGAGKNDLVLDFFAGSGTTAQAVLELNAQDGGNRKFILVQLPEPTERKDFPTIAEITKERVRRVIKKLETEIAAKERKERKENEGQLNLSVGSKGHRPVPDGTGRTLNFTNAAQIESEPLSIPVGGSPSGTGESPVPPIPDLGFKVFKLSSSNFKVWDATTAPKDAVALAEQLKLIAHNVEENRADDALLYELVLKSNLPLTSKVQSCKIGAQTFYDVADGTLAICLERKITLETLRGIIAKKPKGVICLDIAFAGNDQLKTNIVLEMKSRGIEFHTA